MPKASQKGTGPRLEDVLSDQKMSYTTVELEFAVTRIQMILDAFGGDYPPEYRLVVRDLRQRQDTFEKFINARNRK